MQQGVVCIELETMKIIKFLIFFLCTLLSCNKTQTGDASSEVQITTPENASSEVRVTIPESKEKLFETVENDPLQELDVLIAGRFYKKYDERYRNRELRLLSEDSAKAVKNQLSILRSNISNDSSLLLYEKIKPFLNYYDKESLLIYSIIMNSHKFQIHLHNGLLNDKNYSGFSDHLGNEISGKNPMTGNFFPYEQYCDTLTVSFCMDKFGLPDKHNSRRKSAVRLNRAVNSKRYDLIHFYLKNGWLEEINTTVGEDELGNYSVRRYTAIDWAFAQSDTIAADILINYGAKYDKNSLVLYADSIAIEYAFRKLLLKGHTSKYLLDSSLFHATMYGQYDKVNRLLTLGADPNMTMNFSGRTPVFYTLSHDGFPSQDPVLKKFKILKTLIEHGADVDFQDSKGQTPLMLSTYPGCSDGCTYKIGFTKLLIDKGAVLGIKDLTGNTFWDDIVRSKNKPLMDYFIDRTGTPQKYKELYDSISKTIELDENWTTIFDPEATSL